MIRSQTRSICAATKAWSWSCRVVARMSEAKCGGGIPGFRAARSSGLQLLRGRLQPSVRARLIDRRRQVLGEDVERLVDRQAEVRSQLPHLLVAERGAELVGRDRHVGPAAEPGLHLRTEPALLQLIEQALQ